MFLRVSHNIFIFFVWMIASCTIVNADTSENEHDSIAKLNTFLAQKDGEAISNRVTLKQAVITAMKVNYRVMQAKERIFQAEHGTKEAYSDFLPKVDIVSGNTHKKSSGFDDQYYNQTRGDIVTSYNLFSSGEHSETVAKTYITKKEQEERLKGTLEEEIIKVIDAYFSVVYGKMAIEVNRNNYDKLLKILDIVKIKRELGAATVGDENSILASVSNAKTALINTESSYNNAKDYYEFLTNAKLEDLTPFETDFQTNLKPFDEVYDQIKKFNTDVNILETQIQSKQKDLLINSASQGLKIDFSMTNSRRFRDDMLKSASPSEGMNNDFIAEVTFSLNLYDGGKTEARAARIMSEASALVYNLEYTKQDTKWNSQKLFNSVQTNTKTIDTLTTEIDASNKMADAYWEKFRLSSQDLVTLLQAQRQVNNAELEKLRSEKSRVVDYFSLLAKQGKLIEHFGF
ncbi:MAG: TolC family protein [Sulfurospirillum sp.]|uniref:TolC family protein n=1 Tax=Sulfurospirillum sp. UCH001 TaxID=1581011 RepID=UPI000833A044|nr:MULTISPECIES: TolC family protein [unclassified Sulfurospirillum]WNY99799.1 TolC family protein [Sulfurospirillum sp. 'SP']